MKFCKILLAAAVIASVVSFRVSAETAEIPKNELRSAWLPSISTNTSWPGSDQGTSASVAKKQQQSLIAHIDRMVKYNCNALALQVRPMGDALYKSSCEPWSHYLTGKRGTAPTYDPLEFFVKECHARGIEAHAWVNPFRLKKGATPLTAYDQAHIDKGWTITYTHPQEGTTTIFDPGNPEVRKYIVDRVMEIVKNYDVDGVMFDDYFYCPGLPYDITSGYDYAEYKASGTKLSLADWRRENVNKMIAETNAAIKAIKPWVRFGLSPRGIGGGPAGVSAKKYGLPACPASAGDGMYNSIFCDPLAWMAEKSIDYLSPQIYWASTQSNAPYVPICNWWVKVSDKFDVAFYSSVGAYRNYVAGEMGLELNTNRVENHDGDNGVVFYAAGDMDQYDSELKAAFATKSLVPPLRLYSTDDPGKIAELTKNGTTLSCTKLDKVRYAFYAVPKTVTLEDAASKVKTGFNAKYLLGFSYTPTFTLPTDKAEGYWYAVTPYDRYGYEWEATTLGIDIIKPAPEITLVQPENGAQFSEGDITFGVSKIDVATRQTIEISTEITFKEPLLVIDTPSNTSDNTLFYVVPVSTFSEGTYYWRATTEAKGYNDGVSAFRSFSIQPSSTGDYTLITDGEMYNFANHSSAEGKQIRLENLWIRSDNHGNPLGIDTDHCRDFTVVGNTIYIARMEAVSSTAAISLLRYNAETGEQMSTLELTKDDNYKGFYAPLTTVTTDDAGNLLISAMALSANNNVVVGKVNPVTGAVTTVMAEKAAGRVDHIDVIGDINTDAYIIAAGAALPSIYRWHLVNGKVTESKTFAHGVSNNLGTAPRIHAVSKDGAFIDGGSTDFHYYDFAKGKATGVFPSKKAVSTNGGAYFTFDGMPFIVYPHTTFANGICYSIDYGPALPASYENLTNIWQITPKSFGNRTAAGGDFGALAEARVFEGTSQQPKVRAVLPEEDTDGKKAIIYVYAANNALAAYKLDYKPTPSAVDGIADEMGLHLTMNDGILSLGAKADDVEAFTPAGVMIAHATDTDAISLHGQSGLVLVKITIDGKQKTIKIIL
ncbi:MAG: family 10 glycosylhydrolase [Muribaculaceae bacterium]|nr:family 10 glycosylhydrolase [Muribaculaceae bacterium]